MLQKQYVIITVKAMILLLFSFFSFPPVPVMVAWFLFKITLQDLAGCSHPGYLCKPESDPDGGLWLQQQRRG